MNKNHYLILGILLFVATAFFVFQYMRTYLRYRDEFKRKIKNSLPLPIEIFNGEYRVHRKTLKGNLLLYRVHRGELVRNTVLEAIVPKSMFDKIKENCNYYFSYRHEEGLLYFESDDIYIEPASPPGGSMKKSYLLVGSRILGGLIQ